jgi:choline dehydrogenase-like flavoprotein
MELPTEADYVVVGGGLTGCALASRLAKLLPQKSIILLEAGPNPSSHPHTTVPMEGFALQGSELDWSYTTAPVPSVSDRVIPLAAGKTLGGGSVLSM